MKLELMSFTPHLEEIIATAVLTTTTGSAPSKIIQRLSKNPEKIKQVLEGLQLQHGSVLEHNRINWLMEASSSEVLDLLLVSRFLRATKLRDEFWLLSANLRTVVEVVTSERGPLRDALLDSMKVFAPTMFRCLGGNQDES